jgi:hypothetical protein
LISQCLVCLFVCLQCRSQGRQRRVRRIVQVVDQRREEHDYWGRAKETVDQLGVLAEFGFASGEAVEDMLAPPKNQPPDWTKEIVTEVRGTKDGKTLTYRLGTVTCKGALPKGVAPVRAAIWLAEGRIPPGDPPELALDLVLVFKELEGREIYTQVGVTECL